MAGVVLLDRHLVFLESLAIVALRTVLRLVVGHQAHRVSRGPDVQVNNAEPPGRGATVGPLDTRNNRGEGFKTL